MDNKFLRYIKENKGFMIFLLLMFAFRSAIADWNDVPSGSMRPTIVEGDRILINKLAYDIRIPFTQWSLMRLADPERGDIVIFESQAADKRLVKRVVGLPGEKVELRANKLIINGQPVAYRREAMYTDFTLKQEALPGQSHLIRIEAQASPLSNMSAVTVPPGHYLVMGDNRDNSADSRVIGFVPRDEIIGRSTAVAFSLDYDDYFLPRKDRFFHAL
ncbi:Signal peptidase I [Thalassocella blandensis]|nr:Signal peptidase I [Thalassocella blandensis]